MVPDTESYPEEVRRFIDSRLPTPREKSILDILEEKHMLTMIEYIDSHSPLLKTDIYEAVSRSSGMSKKIDELETLGVIEAHQARGMSVITITDKGRKMASIIRSMADTIENWESLV